jgi:hypothetical protein
LCFSTIRAKSSHVFELSGFTLYRFTVASPAELIGDDEFGMVLREDPGVPEVPSRKICLVQDHAGRTCSSD